MLVELAVLGYRERVHEEGPGICKAERRRETSFATLLDQILEDGAALDGLVFAYEELAPTERRAMLLAVVQDAKQPIEALTAFLSVERDPTLRARIGALLGRHAGIERSAFVWGHADQGGAALCQALADRPTEALIFAWNRGELEMIALEPRPELSFFDPGDAVPAAEGVQRVLPMLWRYIRTGRPLPEGVDRFAGFLSLT